MSERMTARSAIGLSLVLGAASSTYAEVMDKEPTLRAVWTTAIVLGIAGLVGWVWSKWLGVGASILALIYAWATHMELSDPFVGRDILAEAGPTYVRQSYAALLVCLALHAIAVAYRIARAKRTPSPPIGASP